MEICYLCGTAIESSTVSKDHVVPRQFIVRKQPMVKGYDYAGKLPTHDVCNNRFGPEVYSQKAIVLIQALYDQDCFLLKEHSRDSNIKVMALNSDCFPGFTEADLKYFKFIDVRNVDYEEWSDPSYFKDKKKSNPKRLALDTALSVLCKSSAALLVSRKLTRLPSCWRVLAVPYIGGSNLDFDEILGETKPFEIGVKAWVKQLETGDWVVVYKASGVFIYFLFGLANFDLSRSLLQPLFEGADEFLFEGSKLVELLDWNWKIL